MAAAESRAATAEAKAAAAEAHKSIAEQKLADAEARKDAAVETEQEKSSMAKRSEVSRAEVAEGSLRALREEISGMKRAHEVEAKVRAPPSQCPWSCVHLPLNARGVAWHALSSSHSSCCPRVLSSFPSVLTRGMLPVTRGRRRLRRIRRSWQR